ncbi:MAG: uroporphyrinogen decarboxylase family protein, partial [Phycisphaeraceae bacterium]|nr:uroporphyrinogen decarboxylase family protein [Phycisphaeraceae bacterium]
MNSRERILAALRGEPVDRVPYFDLYIDRKVIDALYPGMSYEDFVDQEDIDAVTCLAVTEDMDQVEWVDRDRRQFLDKWGAVQQLVGDEFMSMVQRPARLETASDLASYVPPNPDHSPALTHARRLVNRFKGKRAIVAVGEATFAPQQFLRGGVEYLLIDYIDRPAFVEKIARIGVAYYSQLYRKLIAEGVEIILLGDDYAGKHGPMMSPAHFERFILPGLAEVVHSIKDAGGYVIKHSDGDIWPIMDMLIGTGVDMLGPLEPALMDLKKVRDYSGGTVG